MTNTINDTLSMTKTSITEYQGYKCKECSMVVHKKCIRLVNESCTAEGAIQISGDQLIKAG